MAERPPLIDSRIANSLVIIVALVWMLNFISPAWGWERSGAVDIAMTTALGAAFGLPFLRRKDNGEAK